MQLSVSATAGPDFFSGLRVPPRLFAESGADSYYRAPSPFCKPGPAKISFGPARPADRLAAARPECGASSNITR
ncbi:MAG: hypothetical protein WC571_06825, partial [Candidatus Omnitrophota bacterium]